MYASHNNNNDAVSQQGNSRTLPLDRQDHRQQQRQNLPSRQTLIKPYPDQSNRSSIDLSGFPGIEPSRLAPLQNPVLPGDTLTDSHFPSNRLEEPAPNYSTANPNQGLSLLHQRPIMDVAYRSEAFAPTAVSTEGYRADIVYHHGIPAYPDMEGDVSDAVWPVPRPLHPYASGSYAARSQSHGPSVCMPPSHSHQLPLACVANGYLYDTSSPMLKHPVVYSQPAQMQWPDSEQPYTEYPTAPYVPQAQRPHHQLQHFDHSSQHYTHIAYAEHGGGGSSSSSGFSQPSEHGLFENADAMWPLAPNSLETISGLPGHHISSSDRFSLPASPEKGKAKARTTTTTTSSTLPLPKLFKCSACEAVFSRNHDLKRHARIHLAVKPFPCGYCDKAFSRKDALKRHILVKGCGIGNKKSIDGRKLRVASRMIRGPSKSQSISSTPDTLVGSYRAESQTRNLSETACRSGQPQQLPPSHLQQQQQQQQQPDIYVSFPPSHSHNTEPPAWPPALRNDTQSFPMHGFSEHPLSRQVSTNASAHQGPHYQQPQPQPLPSFVTLHGREPLSSSLVGAYIYDENAASPSPSLSMSPSLSRTGIGERVHFGVGGGVGGNNHSLIADERNGGLAEASRPGSRQSIGGHQSSLPTGHFGGPVGGNDMRPALHQPHSYHASPASYADSPMLGQQPIESSSLDSSFYMLQRIQPHHSTDSEPLPRQHSDLT